jgi:hypothetical protein
MKKNTEGERKKECKEGYLLLFFFTSRFILCMLFDSKIRLEKGEVLILTIEQAALSRAIK